MSFVTQLEARNLAFALSIQLTLSLKSTQLLTIAAAFVSLLIFLHLSFCDVYT